MAYVYSCNCDSSNIKSSMQPLSNVKEILMHGCHVFSLLHATYTFAGYLGRQSCTVYFIDRRRYRSQCFCKRISMCRSPTLLINALWHTCMGFTPIWRNSQMIFHPSSHISEADTELTAMVTVDGIEKSRFCVLWNSVKCWCFACWLFFCLIPHLNNMTSDLS